MSNCLNETQIRAFADGEASDHERQHVEGCAQCQARAKAAVRALEEFSALASSLPVPASAVDGVTRALRRSTPDRAGATTLRELPRRRTVPRVWLTAGAIAAAVLLVAFLMPAIDAPRELSAAEILGRSLETMSPSSGIELLEYDLTVKLPSVAAIEDGTYRIEQLFDHNGAGRFRILKYGPDGTLIDGVSEDTGAGRRSVFLRVDKQPFIFDFTIDPARRGSLRTMQQRHIEAGIRILQSISGDSVTEASIDGVKHYVVSVPKTVSPDPAGAIDLEEARIVVDATDYEIVEASASGSYMGEVFSVSFRLRRRVAAAEFSPAPDFELPRDPAAVKIEGIGTEDIAHDVLSAALQGLARAKR